MNKYEVGDNMFDKHRTDTRENSNEHRKVQGTLSVPEDLANIIYTLKLSADPSDLHTSLREGNILDKMEIMSLYKPKRQGSTESNLRYLQEVEHLEKSPDAKDIFLRRQKLPIYEYKDKILRKIFRNQVTIVCSEAGCGKTTQIPQYILDNAIKSNEGSMCRIICTEPKRRYAIQAAKRVAEERCVSIGYDSPVGYHIRNDNQSARSNASITYFTSGIILKHMFSDPFLNQVSHLIIDEVQERDVVTDLLLRLIKKLLTKRPNIKVIILCATIYHKDFMKYFNNCGRVKVPGFRHPVEQLYLEDILSRINFSFSPSKTEKTSSTKNPFKFSEREKYPKHVVEALNDPNSEKLSLELIVCIILDINAYGRDGAILVFLPGVGDIISLQTILADRAWSDMVIPIHGNIINNFQNPKTTDNKIYLATNVVESALNLDDVSYVIDTGRVKTRHYDNSNTESLSYEWISLKNVEQRKRKAGRAGPGKCFHLFKKSTIAQMEPYPVPDISKMNLQEVILKIKLDNLGKAKDILTECITPIPEELINKTVQYLQMVNVLDADENLTIVGRKLLNLTMDPAKSKMIYLGAIFSCLEPILTIAAHLIKNSIVVDSPITPQQCTSDQLLYYQMLKQFEETEDSKKTEFCKKHHVNAYQIAMVQKTKEELANKLKDICQIGDYKCASLNKNSEDMNLIRAILCVGLYPSVAIIRNYLSSILKNISVITLDGSKRQIHYNSVNAKQTNYVSPLLLYNGVYITNDVRYLCETTLAFPLSLVMFTGKLTVDVEDEHVFMHVSKYLKFRCDSIKTAVHLLQLREKLDLVIENEINNFSIIDWNGDSDKVRILRTVVNLINTEDSGDSVPYVL